MNEVMLGEVVAIGVIWNATGWVGWDEGEGHSRVVGSWFVRCSMLSLRFLLMNRLIAGYGGEYSDTDKCSREG